VVLLRQLAARWAQHRMRQPSVQDMGHQAVNDIAVRRRQAEEQMQRAVFDRLVVRRSRP